MNICNVLWFQTRLNVLVTKLALTSNFGASMQWSLSFAIVADGFLVIGDNKLNNIERLTAKVVGTMRLVMYECLLARVIIELSQKHLCY